MFWLSLLPFAVASPSYPELDHMYSTDSDFSELMDGFREEVLSLKTLSAGESADYALSLSKQGMTAKQMMSQAMDSRISLLSPGLLGYINTLEGLREMDINFFDTVVEAIPRNIAYTTFPGMIGVTFRFNSWIPRDFQLHLRTMLTACVNLKTLLVEYCPKTLHVYRIPDERWIKILGGLTRGFLNRPIVTVP